MDTYICKLTLSKGKYLMSDDHNKFFSGCGFHSSFFVIHVESALCAWGLSSGTWELTVKLVSTYSAHLLMESEHAWEHHWREKHWFPNLKTHCGIFRQETRLILAPIESLQLFSFIHSFKPSTPDGYHSITATKSNSQNWTQVNQHSSTHKTQHNITQINFLERTHIPRRSCFTTAKTWSQTSQQTMWASRAPTASAGINLFLEGKYRVAEVPAKLKVHFWRIHKCKVWSPCEAEPASPLCGGCPGPPTLPAWAAWWVLALFTIHPPHCVHWSAFVFGEGPRCRTNQMISAKGEQYIY